MAAQPDDADPQQRQYRHEGEPKRDPQHSLLGGQQGDLANGDELHALDRRSDARLDRERRSELAAR